jgi:hypothetical protein
MIDQSCNEKHSLSDRVHLAHFLQILIPEFLTLFVIRKQLIDRMRTPRQTKPNSPPISSNFI